MPITDDPNDPELRVIDPETNMQMSYLVLSDEERAKGFVRPVRNEYVHVGIPGPTYPLRELSAEERERWSDVGYVAFEAYPDEAEGHSTGRYWQQARLDKVDKGCGAVTWMGDALAETYAREPGYYGGTYCASCRNHFPVGKDGEFVWAGTDERVGT